MSPQLRSLPAALVCALAVVAPVFAQTPARPAAAPPSPSTSETVQLSPFEVAAEKDDGYKATSTLAGTRLRTELRDVAASISVITKDFMQDIEIGRAHV